MKRSLIDLILEATNEAETPRNFLYWCSLAAIGAVANNNVYLNRRGADGRIIYKLSPNLFVILIAKSGLGKGFPINLVRRIVKKVDNTRVISGQNSIQGIIKEMATTKTKERGEQIMDSRAFLVSGEFHNLMINDPDALTVLTEWYDTHFMEDWSKTLKGSPVEELKKLNVSLLGGSSPEHFDDSVPEVNIKGGFIGRTLMVFASQRGRINPLTMVDEPDDEERFECITPEIMERAYEIASLRGRFKWTQKAKDIYDPWHIQMRERDDIDDKTGTANRITDNVLKVSMCLSMSRRNTLTLEPQDVDEAIEKCLGLTVNTKKMTEGRGEQPLAKATKDVLDALLTAENYTLSRKALLNRGYGAYDADDLDRIEKTLQQRGAIHIERDGEGFRYRMTDEMVEQYSQHLRNYKKEGS